MHIGLVGGIGPAATDFYYTRIINRFASLGVELELTIAHADSSTLLANLASDDKHSQIKIYERLTNRLKTAGADCVVVTSIAGHFCIKEFGAISPLPVIDMLEEVRRALATSKIERVGILGTRTVMETKFYGGITTCDVIPPVGDDLDLVHEAYVTMAVTGHVTNNQRRIFEDAGHRLIKDAGASAIMLGGTDLALVFKADDTPFTIIDCAAIHADAVITAATT